VRPTQLSRAFAIAALAAGLVLGAPAVSPASTLGEGAPAADAGAAHAVPPLVTRVDGRPPRVTVQPSFLAVLPGASPALAAPTLRSHETSLPPGGAGDRLVGYVRTSRGPPLG
jgi:hypothetical protein